MNRLKKSTVLAAMAMMACAACTTNNVTSQDGPLHIDFTDATQVKDLTMLEKMMRDVEIVPLEAREEALVRYGNKIRMTDENIILLDRTNPSKQLMIFDREGKWVRSSQRGKGPNEVIGVSDFDVDQSTGNIIVADAGRITLFDKNLNVLHSYKDTMRIDYCAVVHDKYVLKSYSFKISEVGQGVMNKVYVTDTAMNVERSYNFVAPMPMPSFAFNDIAPSAEGPLVFIPLNDTIFLCTDSVAVPKYVMDYNLTKCQAKKEVNENDGYVTFTTTEGVYFSGFMQNDEVQSFILSGQRMVCFRNMKTGKTVTMDMESNDYDFAPYTATGNRFVTLLYYETIEKHSEMLKRLLSPEGVEKIEAMNEDSNPALLIFRIDI